MNKHIITAALAAVIVGGLGFFGGIKYQQKKGGINLDSLRNLPREQRQEMFGQFRRQGGAGQMAGGQNAGFLSGEIISKDDKSITVKLWDGGSKIIFLSAYTSIGKTAQGATSDLETGKQVVITGNANSDGTVSAQNIQIRPVMPATEPPK